MAVSFTYLLPLSAQTSVTLVPITSPRTAEPAVTIVAVTGSGFPPGTVLPADVKVTLTPASGTPATAPAISVRPILGTTEQVTFQIPGSIAPAVPADYQVSLTGMATSGASFVSGNSSALTVNPPAQILSLSPTAGNASLAVPVTISGLYTNFLQGVTQASFGPGILVGGNPPGQPGPVTVTGPTTAVAQLFIPLAANPGARTVSVSTGLEQATANFTVGPPGAIVNIDLTTSTAIASGLSGFNDGHQITAVEYYDPKFVAAVQLLKPGWIRFPGGTPTMAFDWQAGHENQAWIDSLTMGNPPKVSSFTAAALKSAQQLTQAMGGVNFKDYAAFVKTIGASAIVCFNSVTDTNSDSATQMVGAARGYGLNVIEWEMANEPYFYPLIFPGPAAYASAMQSPYYASIVSVDPTATVGLFYEGKYDFITSKYMAWDNGMNAYSPRFWNGVSTHYYPILNKNIATADEEATLNGVLAHGTAEYINSYLIPLIGPNTPIFITEMNSSIENSIGTPLRDGKPNFTGAVAFSSYLYNGIYLAEYIARMSTVTSVKAVGVSSLYLGNAYNHGMIKAVDDHQAYLLAQLRKNPNYSTNTATNPNTQFEFYYTAASLAVGVANMAINSSTHIWPTTVTGGPMVPVKGFDGKPIPAIFAQGYMGDNGRHYLLITNKSGSSVPVSVQANGATLARQLLTTYVSNASDTADNTAEDQNVVRYVTSSSFNPLTIGPYSVTTIEW